MNVYVVLAAGGSHRMGFVKALAPLGDGPAPLQLLDELLQQRDVVLVTSTAQRERSAALVPRFRIVVNSEPQRGMASSLRAALDACPEDAWIGVVLADKPFLTRSSLLELESELDPDVDVVYPSDASGTGGHPVFFAPRMRARLRELPDGDTLRALRDAPGLVRREVRCDDPGAYWDLDTPADWDDAIRRKSASE